MRSWRWKPNVMVNVEGWTFNSWHQTIREIQVFHLVNFHGPAGTSFKKEAKKKKCLFKGQKNHSFNQIHPRIWVNYHISLSWNLPCEIWGWFPSCSHHSRFRSRHASPPGPLGRLCSCYPHILIGVIPQSIVGTNPTRMCVCIYIYLYMYICLCIDIYIYMYIYIYVCLCV